MRLLSAVEPVRRVGRPARWVLGAAFPPALAWLFANVVFWLAARAHHYRYLRPKTWIHADAKLYESIAAHGYVLEHCVGLHLHHYGVANWCGNAGWFPGYPALLWLGRHIGMGGPVAGVVVAALFEYVLLFVLWNCLLTSADSPPATEPGWRSRAAAVLALATAAVFFGAVYQRAVFPISAELTFILLTLWCAHRRRWLWAGVAGAAAAFTYATGFLIVPAVGLWILVERSIRPSFEKVRAIALACGLSVVGYLAVFLLLRVQTGRWNAFFLVQAKYHYSGLHWPLAKLRLSVIKLLQRGLHVHEYAGVQTFLVACFMIAILTWGAANIARLTALDRLVLCAAACFWFFPLALGGDVHLYRSEALLLPAVLIWRRFPLSVQAYGLGVFTVLAYGMSVAFFRGVLV